MYGFRRSSGGAGGAGNVVTVSGGANNRITLWNGATSITGDAAGTWTGTGDTFVLGSPTFNASQGHFTGPAAASFGPSQVGGGFTNQPTGDTVTFASSDAGDTTQQITIIGTLAGADAGENILLNGVTPVVSVGTYTKILALVLNGPCVGTVTASKTTGLLAITTIAPAALSAGLQTFAAVQGYGKVMQIVASGTTTKTVGVGGYAIGGGIQHDPVVMNGTTTTNTNLTFSSAVQFYLGDLENTRTVTLSNISGFDFNKQVYPLSDNVYDLGIPQFRWRTGYFGQNIALSTTTSSTTGVIFKGADRFLHNFALAGTDGLNTFGGVLSGNFTMTGSTGAGGSYNTGFGYSTLPALTIGSHNVAVGTYALKGAITGIGNNAVGVNALPSLVSGSFNTANGYVSLFSNITGSNNVGTGTYALYLATGSNNVAVGYKAGYHATNAVTTGSTLTFVGYQSGLGSASQRTNATAIGANATVDADNTVALGDGTVTQVRAGSAGQADVVMRHPLGAGTSPTVVGNGTTPGTIAGKDAFLKVTVGTGVTTSIVITYGTAFATAPVVVCNADTTTTAINVTSSTTTATLTTAAFTAGEVLHVMSGGF